jgi:hypothetical protein
VCSLHSHHTYLICFASLSLGYEYSPSSASQPHANTHVSPRDVLSANQGFSNTFISAGQNVTIQQHALPSPPGSIAAPALIRSSGNCEWFVEKQPRPEGGIDNGMIRRAISVMIRRVPGVNSGRERNTGLRKEGCMDVEYGMRVMINPNVQVHSILHTAIIMRKVDEFLGPAFGIVRTEAANFVLGRNARVEG